MFKVLEVKKRIKVRIQSGFFWQITKGIFRLIDHIHWYKQEVLSDFRRKTDQYFSEKIFEEAKVKEGIFKGMKYDKLQSFGSSLYPKLIGTYELEIQNVLEKIINIDKPKTIIDIGCAEGYYAVGMALRLPDSKVYAFDIDDEARELCLKMAELNGVEGNVVIAEEYTDIFLDKFSELNSSLVICDCEGCEASLFNLDNIHKYSNCILIIELHEFIKEGITKEMRDLFSPSHKTILVEGEKRLTKQLRLPNLKLNAFQKEYLMDEMRPCKMDWLYCIPKN